MVNYTELCNTYENIVDARTAKNVDPLEVYGFDGKLLKTFTKDFKHLAISDLQSGVYPILIKTNGKAYGEKLIVRK
ncbi:T9SS type A sorting domain-containing protein [Soonwooa sp.]|uniref:T9SS type A sorting domain-containing protein n=1 Tax=Soonwooa sp. TaxID=1938592 RepID=UPI00261AAB7F|nr:T9SS type A sorting domain-containing protein [Soonwooa sp.]